MKVRDIMKPARWTVGLGDSLERAERIIAHRRGVSSSSDDADERMIGAQPTVGADGRLAGSVPSVDALQAPVV